MAALQDTDCVKGTLEGISEQIWREKYRHGEEASITDSWDRVARALAAVEDDAESWTGVFRNTLSGFGFLPAGRILAGAGTGTVARVAGVARPGRIGGAGHVR